VGVRPPLPAPDLNPFGSFGLWRRIAPEETSTLSAKRYSQSVNAVDVQKNDTRRTFHANRTRSGFALRWARITGIRHLWLPRTVLETDSLVSMLTIKTHDWSDVTLA